VTRRVITGIGVASPLGIGRSAFFAALHAGTRAAAPPQTFDGSRYGGDALVAEVPGFDPTKFLGDKGLRTLDRLAKLMIVASRLALEDCGLKAGGVWAPSATSPPATDALGRSWPERVGLVVSNAYGSIEAITELDRVAVLEDARYINPARFPLTVSNSAAGYVSIWEDLRALNVSVSDGNCGALDAFTCADLFLASGRADVLLVGGAEAMTEGLYASFLRLGGPVRSRGPHESVALLGEGAALLVVETLESARSRGAAELAEIVGFGSAFEPPGPDGALVRPSASAAERAIAAALDDAGVDAGAIDVVVSGLSGAVSFDDAELSAIDRAIGSNACVVAPKLAWGETFGAGGALAMLGAIGIMREGARGYVVRGQIRGPVRTALVTSVGYYGNASALVMRAGPP
jgi:3-oxoacyl-(acyl-carrier-protein) synthase